MKITMESASTPDGKGFENALQIQNADLKDAILLGLDGSNGFEFALLTRQRWLDLQEVVEVVFGARGRAE